MSLTVAPCPECSSENAKKVSFTWWGGAVGPWLLNHVKCQDCGAKYNSKSGESNSVAIAIYFVVVNVVMLVGAVAFFGYMATRR